MRYAKFDLARHAKLVVLFIVLALGILGLPQASAQSDNPCHGEDDDIPDNPVACPNQIPLEQGSFHAIPLMDGNKDDYYGEKVSLYGALGSDGNDERSSAPGLQHYQEGVNRAMSIQPLALNGQPSLVGGSIVFLFIGFSNCTIEICGGDRDLWELQGHQLTGQPCSTNCNNPMKTPPPNYNPWDKAANDLPAHSLLYQLYSPSPHLVGSHVYVFDGAAGKQTLDKWDPSGYYAQPGHDCPYNGLPQTDPECDYDRAARDLHNNGFSDNQVQAIFIKSANSYPNCDLSGQHCLPNATLPDAYQAEKRLGNILRYLKCCKADGTPRYPNLKLVFITSRIYGGYAKNPDIQGNGQYAGCLNPEPYAYELGFSVQRIIVSQIKQQYGPGSNDQYSGPVDYAHAPWFDWGPYLWASGEQPRSDSLVWCNNQPAGFCANQRDVRDGDLENPAYWGDFTHPSAKGAEKVANQLVKFITGQLPQQPQGYISDWVTPWRNK